MGLKSEKLQDECSGDCPRCGERPAYPRYTPEILHGYFDSCDECVDEVMKDAIAEYGTNRPCVCSPGEPCDYHYTTCNVCLVAPGVHCVGHPWKGKILKR